MKILVVNCGSSSIKYQLIEMPGEKPLARGVVEKIGEENSKLTHNYDTKAYTEACRIADHRQAMALILDTLVSSQAGVIDDISEIAAVGHRVVHGGEEFTGSVIIDDNVIASVEKFADLAPLHNPPNLTGIQAAREKLPNVPQVACFDTAFHTSIPEVAYMYALPYELYEKYRIRRYGFHGTSHRYVARRCAQIMGKDKYDLNVITCHLGNGCSMAAVKDGRSVDTSMGLTPLEGLVMGTRSGDFDPAIIFYLADKGYDIARLNKLCNKQSGLLGLSGESNDMRNLCELAEKNNPRAALAIDIFCYRIIKYIGAYTAVLGRVDAIVFTGGIGENATAVREKICDSLSGVGIKIDSAANASGGNQHGEINSPQSRVKVFVIPTNEEAAIAADTYQLVS